MYISRLISLVTAYDPNPTIPGAYVSALVVLVQTIHRLANIFTINSFIAAISNSSNDHVHSFVCSFICSSVHSFVHSFCSFEFNILCASKLFVERVEACHLKLETLEVCIWSLKLNFDVESWSRHWHLRGKFEAKVFSLKSKFSVRVWLMFEVSI